MSDRQRVEFPCVLGCEWPDSTVEDPKPRPAKVGLLCRRCFYGLERAIAELPSQHAELVERLQPGESGAGPYVTGSPSHPLPIDPRVAAHRSDIADKLTSWARMVAEERGEIGPLNPRPETTAAYLVTLAEWCASQPWIDDLVNEMRDLRGRAFSLLFPRGRRHIEVGPCPMDNCAGTLTATLADEDDRACSVDCDENPEHAWDSTQWLRLGSRINQRKGAA